MAGPAGGSPVVTGAPGPTGRTVGSAIGRLFAVIDAPEAVDAAWAALVAAGIEPAAIETFAGPGGATAFDPSGARRGFLGRVLRILEFSWADQAPISRGTRLPRARAGSS